MKPLHNSTRIIAFVVLAVALVCGTQFTGCTEQPSVTVPSGPAHLGRTYIIPSAIDTFNAGQIHNAEIEYIFSHYDTLQYGTLTNKFSQNAVDSLAALFIADSLQPSIGSFSPTEISQGEAIFDSTFNACLSTIPTNSQLVVVIDSAEAHGILASDEGNFIINADTDIRQCTTYSQSTDTVNSLISQYSSISWSPSTSNGLIAYEYLSIANASSHLWGGLSGNGGGGDPVPIAAKPIATDAGTFAAELTLLLAEGVPFDEAVQEAAEAGTAASLGVGSGNGGGGGGGGGTGGSGGGSGWLPILIFVVITILGV